MTAKPAAAQWYKIKGTAYDSLGIYPLQSVSVLSTSGKGTVTDSNGHYAIDVTEKDSIWFSYLNKPTIKFAVLKITNPFEFDISLKINIPVLKEVRIRPRNYKLDSMQNREDYAKIFNYQRPGLKTVTPQYGAGVGFDLDEIINMFRFRRNRSLLSFQKRLMQEERVKFIDHRFNKALVRRLTRLSGAELDSFMRIYRPSYPFTLLSAEYDFQKHIRDSFERYKKGLPPLEALKPEEF
jgi:plasmid maintenance system killer protein